MTENRHWALGLGEARHVRDESAARIARSEEDDAARAAAVSADRWAAIVMAIRRLVDAYNLGARRPVLTVVEDAAGPTVTVAISGENTRYLLASLEDTLICVQAQDSSGLAHAMEIRLRPDRADDATAAYVLQNWMQHL